MKYIKIKGSSYSDVTMKLKREHGEDAIPISHRYVKEGGLFRSKLFAKEVVELTAAVQERKFVPGLKREPNAVDLTIGDEGTKKSQAPSGRVSEIINRAISSSQNDSGISAGTGGSHSVREQGKIPLPKSEGVSRSADEIFVPGDSEGERGYDVSVKPSNAHYTSNANDRLEKELEEIKRTLYRLSKEDGFVKKPGSPVREDEKYIRPYMDVLEKNDFNPEQCSVIFNEVKNSISRDDLKDRYKIEKSLKDLLKSRIVTTGPIKTGNKKKVVMFIGPTGVGKTTTMAKLGAINSLREGHSVSFISIDNYRIAATEQLKKYAEIMNIPIFTVNNQKEFKDIIAKQKSEIIMVDTSGRSHRNDLKISEIKSFAEMVEYDFEKILCVSATTKKIDLSDIFKAFDVIHFNSIVITKVDETSYIGNVVDIADKYNKPISYLTNGQEVPNDIMVANADKIVDMMIGDVTLISEQ